MLKNTYQIHTFILIFFLILSSIFAQEVGQIFDKTEADNLFGEVLEHKEMSSNQLTQILQGTDDNAMFLLGNNQITILGDDRDLLYSTTSFTDENQVFHLYSKSKVLALIQKGGENTLRFENRNDVFTITNGAYTLEYAINCPPDCP